MSPVASQYICTYLFEDTIDTLFNCEYLWSTCSGIVVSSLCGDTVAAPRWICFAQRRNVYEAACEITLITLNQKQGRMGDCVDGKLCVIDNIICCLNEETAIGIMQPQESLSHLPSMIANLCYQPSTRSVVPRSLMITHPDSPCPEPLVHMPIKLWGSLVRHSQTTPV
jgi:hypothetical protein